LEEAIKAGKEAEQIGEHYHPAANACFDKMPRTLVTSVMS